MSFSLVMKGALTYRSNGRSLTSLAFACALAICAAAVALAENKGPIERHCLVCPSSEIIGVDVLPETSPPDQPIFPLPPLPDIEQAFPEEQSVTRRGQTAKRAKPIVAAKFDRGPRGSLASTASIHALVLYGPRPPYPYEAWRSHITGFGVAVVIVDPVGNATDVQMKQSTGSPILDRATIETLRRWRFKPIAGGTIQVPITYMLTGVSY